MTKVIKDLSASVRERLSQLARARGDAFEHVLTRYGLERLLYRLTNTEHGERFVLKGAMLFAIWSNTPHRPTMDADFLVHGDSDMTGIETVFKAVCQAKVVDDGLQFNANSIRIEEIRENQEYDGLRLRLVAMLGTARIPLQIDIGFGDVVTPSPVATQYPALLEFPAPTLKTYPRETVIAEKFEAMVRLGAANTRMKDFYDVWLLSEESSFDGALITTAVESTFERRKTLLPNGAPAVFQAEFAAEKQRQQQWAAFLKRIGAEALAPAWTAVCERIGIFLRPVYDAAKADTPAPEKWEKGAWHAVIASSAKQSRP